MAQLESEIATYDSMRASLEAEHQGEWVVVHNGTVHLYDDFQDAAHNAVQQFGRGPYLIRQIGAEPLSVPGHMLYRS